MELETLYGALFANDAVLPSQFGSKSEDPYSRERLLWANVLVDAVVCVQKCPPEVSQGDYGGYEGAGGVNRRRKTGLKARAWFASGEIEPGSFVWVCQILDCDPNYLRGRLAAGVTLKRRPPVTDHHGVTLARSRARHRPHFYPAPLKSL